MKNLQVESDMNKIDDDIMLPGFRFHPTDEELVGFYLKRKIRYHTLPIELIKQVDIYKYDPWDLPKLASSGEKEWYFYCPRDRKYRNSARPNRVTLAGFWKATGTDRPIYSSNNNECIGLKKSLVFYRGRAAKGIKTDWMMHEFRLPSIVSSTSLPKNAYAKTLPPNDSWAICKIFKKNATMAQRAFSRSWDSQMYETKSSGHMLNQNAYYNPFSPDLSCSTTKTSSPIHLPNDNHIQSNSTASLSTLNVPASKQILYQSPVKPFPFPFSTEYHSLFQRPKSTIDVDSVLVNVSPTLLNDSVGKLSDNVVYKGNEKQTNGVLIDPIRDDNEWGNMELLGSPFSLSTNMLGTWKNDFIWNSPLHPSDVSADFSTNQCDS